MKKPGHTNGSGSLVNSHNIQKNPPFKYVPNNKLDYLTNIISILKQWYEVLSLH